MKRLFKFKYPKIFLLIIFIIFAYLLFSTLSIASYFSKLGELGYIAVFLFGMLFPFGFTTPFSVGFFVTLNPSNVIFSGLVAGFAAMFSDLLLFKFVKFSFQDEFERFKKERFSRKFNSAIRHTFGKKVQHYLIYAFAGLIIASPLPNEAGVTMLAGLSHIEERWLAVISFICNTLGIMLLLWI